MASAAEARTLARDVGRELRLDGCFYNFFEGGSFHGDFYGAPLKGL